MYNEIYKKLTSLTLMAIMVAGGMTFAVPGMVPEAYAANANLFVSAENSLFDNYMSGPQVIEVAIIDSSISDTDEGKGEPDVTVNGNNLRMVQATDGNWYGYFADYEMATEAAKPGNGLYFGTSGSASDIGLTEFEADGLFYNNKTNDNVKLNVVRESKNVNDFKGGQIGIAENNWPFIQLYTLNPTGNVVIQYNKGGGAQTTTLTFDTVDDFAGIELDRTSYPQGAQVHATVTDVWLNIDPTDEDSWTFATNDGTAFYHIFNDNGGNGTNNADVPVDPTELMCSDCALLLNPNVQGADKHVITIQGNADSMVANDGPTVATADAWRGSAVIENLDEGTQPVTITEQGPNSGIFGTYDEADKSVLKIIDDAARGTSATLDYNDSPVSVLVTHAFAEIDIQPTSDTWNSGELIPVVLVDADINKNTRADENISLSDPSYQIIPSLRTGNPITLGSGDIMVSYDGSAMQGTDVDAFSDRAILDDAMGGDTVSSVLIDLGITGGDLKGSLINSNADNTYGYNLFNYNIDSLTDENVNISLVHGDDLAAPDGTIKIVCDASNSGLELLPHENCKQDIRPSEPTALSASPRSATSVALSWTASENAGSSSITDYKVEYRIANTNNWMTFDDGVSTSTMATVTGLTDGTEYAFRVSAVNSVGTGYSSDEDKATATNVQNKPDAPSDLMVTSQGDTQIMLSWAAPSDGGSPITSYTIQQSNDLGSTFKNANTTSPVTGITATVTGLDPETTYIFQVSAVNSIGPSDYSDRVSAKTTPASNGGQQPNPNTPNVAPVITAITPKAATVGQALTFTVVATDANPADTTFTYSFSQPQGQTLTSTPDWTPTTGVFTWTPDAADIGDKIFTFIAMDDGAARSAPVSVTITVSAASNGGSNNDPVVTPGQAPSGIAGTALEHQILATDDDAGDSLTYTLINGPGTLTISRTGLIEWDAPSAGSHEVSFRVSDGTSTVRGTITITITAPTPTSIVIPLLYNSGSAYESQHFGAAFDEAVSDYDTDSPKTFSSQKLNLGTTPIQAVLDTGAKGAVGTYTSEQLRILNDTDKIGTGVGDIVLLSYSSAATSFAEPGDGIFRLTTDTSRQVEHIVTELIPSNFDNIISIHLDDAWSNDYVDALETTYGNNHRTIAYDTAYDTTPANMTAQFASVLSDTTTGLSGLDAQTAIVILEFDHDRLDALVTELARTNGYANIETTKFIIPDVPSGAFGSTLHADALTLLKSTDMKTIKFALSDNEQGQTALKAALQAQSPNNEVDLDSFGNIFDRHAYAAYDAGQILTRAIDALGTEYTSAQLDAAIPTAAAAYSSDALIYNTVLNANGDLQCMIYDIFEIDDTQTGFALSEPTQATTDATNCAITYPPTINAISPDAQIVYVGDEKRITLTSNADGATYSHDYDNPAILFNERTGVFSWDVTTSDLDDKPINIETIEFTVTNGTGSSSTSVEFVIVPTRGVDDQDRPLPERVSVLYDNTSELEQKFAEVVRVAVFDYNADSNPDKVSDADVEFDGQSVPPSTPITDTFEGVAQLMNGTTFEYTGDTIKREGTTITKGAIYNYAGPDTFTFNGTTFNHDSATHTFGPQFYNATVGTYTSAQLETFNTEQWADDMVFLSYASTASTLSLDDHIFRLTADNAYQVENVLKPELDKYDGKIITIHRNDTWSADYVDILKGEYSDLVEIQYNASLYHRINNADYYNDTIGEVYEAEFGTDGIPADSAIVIFAFDESREIVQALARAGSNDGWQFKDVNDTRIIIPDLSGDFNDLTDDAQSDPVQLLKDTNATTIRFDVKNSTLLAGQFHNNPDSSDEANFSKYKEITDVAYPGSVNRNFTDVADNRHIFSAYDAGYIMAKALDIIGPGPDQVEQLKELIPWVANQYSDHALIHNTKIGANGDLEEMKYVFVEINDNSTTGDLEWMVTVAHDPDAGTTASVQMFNSPQLVSCIDCAINSFGEIFGQTVQIQQTQSVDADTVTELFNIPNNAKVGLLIEYDRSDTDAVNDPIVLDFFSFGFTNDGTAASDRVSNQIVRLELEETGDNTDTFIGGLEYVMLNQLNILDKETYTGLSPISDEPTFIVMEDLTDEDSPRVNYLDLGADGVSTQIADQQEAPSHSGVVALDSDNYKVADTVIITLTDADLNVDSDLIDIFTTVAPGNGDMSDTVGKDVKFNDASVSIGDAPLGRLLDVTIDDKTWTVNNCDLSNIDDGLHDTGFTLIETSTASGVFTGSFQIPSEYCPEGETERKSVTGNDLEVNYVDFRDASGEIIEVGDSAGVRASTGSISLDRTVYPVPFGENTFNLHASAGDDEYLPEGTVSLHVRVSDPDYDISASGEDVIAEGTTGPVTVTVSRGSDSKVVATAGAASANANQVLEIDGENVTVPEYGPITEIAPDAGIFEADITISSTDGPYTRECPDSNGCVLQGDIITVQYEDPTDASGDANTITDSATFDLRNAVLQSDKSVYIIGSDMILTLIEPDFDLDSDGAETYSLDLIEWDSDAATTSMGPLGGDNAAAFDPEPNAFRETGDSTGIFQVVVEIPEALSGDKLERGEEIELEYTDWGPSGSNYVGEEDEDINLTVFTSNFGSTVELDQKVYTWTDKVYITIVAPDHNFDSDLIDEIGNSDDDPIRVATRSADLDNYKLVETGTDTGIFTGEVILTGFAHDANGDGETDDSNPRTGDGTGNIKGLGPTNGFLETEDDDGLSVSFEFSEDETVIGSSLIRWNIGEVQWLEASYAASGTGLVRVVDPDMNLNPESVDNFEIDIWSDTHAGGIDLTVTETNQATGIFEGTVFFTVTDESSGHRLRVSEGDTVTAEYADRTLPDPHDTTDKIDISATTQIGSLIPPLERAPATNLRVVDAFSNTLDTISVDSQVQITADLANGQDKDQPFAYIVQIQDSSSVTVALAWVSGTLTPSQSFSPALSWTPSEAGTYTATAFVWESVDNPTALSPPNELTITVN